MKRVEGDLERIDIEKRSLATKVESLNQLKVQLQEKVDDRENVIQSLTETIEQLVHGVIVLQFSPYFDLVLFCDCFSGFLLFF